MFDAAQEENEIKLETLGHVAAESCFFNGLLPLVSNICSAFNPGDI